MIATTHQAAAIWADLVQRLPARRPRQARCLQRRVSGAKALDQLGHRLLCTIWHRSKGAHLRDKERKIKGSSSRKDANILRLLSSRPT